MEWALDPITNQLVRASEHGVVRRRRYICPSCGAGVYLRKGHIRVPHFAHVSGQAGPDCENYWPSFGTTPAPQRDRPYRSVDLYLCILDERDPPYPWHLEVGVPEPETTAGRLRFPFAWGGERILPVCSIGQGGRRIRVRPQAQPYYIVCEEVPEGFWASRIRQPISGLRTGGITVFRYSNAGGRRLPEERPLYWGRKYALIWDPSGSPSWWPRAERLDARPLQNVEPWSGALIKLPTEYDRQVQAWVNQWLHRTVERPPAQLTLVSPLPERRLADGSFLVPSSVEVIIGVVGEEGSKEWAEMMVATSDSEKIERYKGSGSVPVLYSLGRLQAGRTVFLWLDDCVEDGLQLVCVPDPLPPLVFPEINLYGKVISEDREVVAPLHSPEAGRLLRQVRQQEVELAGIGLPNGVPLTIRWRSRDDHEWQSWTPSRSEKLNLHEEMNVVKAIVSRLQELLLDPSLSLELDAGEFGQITVEFLQQSATGRPLSMGRHWRERVRWLLSFSPLGCGVLGSCFERIHPPYPEVSVEGVNVQDQRLVRALLWYPSWPLVLEPHVRAVLSEWRGSIRQAACCARFTHNKEQGRYGQ